MLGAAALNLILNVALIPRYAGAGAAWATLLAYAFYLAGSWRLAQRYYPVPYEWGRLLNVAVQTAAAGFALMLSDPPALRLAIVAIWVVTAAITSLFRLDFTSSAEWLKRSSARLSNCPGPS